MTQAKWYVNVNDLIGGYSVGTVSGPASENRQYGDIADFMTEEHAIEIVQLHEEVSTLVTIRDLIARNDEKREKIKGLHAEIDALRRALLPFAAAIRGLDIDESERSEIAVEFGLYQLTFQHFYDALTTFQTYDSTGRLDQEPIDNSAIGLIISREEGTTDGDDQPPQNTQDPQGKIRPIRKNLTTRP